MATRKQETAGKAMKLKVDRWEPVSVRLSLQEGVEPVQAYVHFAEAFVASYVDGTERQVVFGIRIPVTMKYGKAELGGAVRVPLHGLWLLTPGSEVPQRCIERFHDGAQEK